MKLGSRETFQNLRRKVAGYKEKSNFYQPAKHTSLIKFSASESGVLAPKRTNYVQLFQTFTQTVVPSMEKRIEFDLLRHQFKNITDNTVKLCLMQAYLRRMTLMRSIEMSKGDIVSHPQQFEGDQLYVRPNVELQIPLYYAEQPEIGLFAKFPLSELKKYFKHQEPGNYGKEFFRQIKKFSVQLTEEGVYLMEYMRNSLRHEYIYHQLAVLNENQTLKFIYQEENFQKLFSTLRGDLAQALEKYRKDPLIHRMFVTSPVFDSIISTLIKEMSLNNKLLKQLCEPKHRKQFMNSIVDQIKEKMDLEQINANLPDLFHKTIKELTLGSHKINLLDYVEKPFTVPESFDKYRFPGFVNCGNTVLVNGKQGTGKSGLIIQTSMWAHKSGWAVITVPSAYRWTQEEQEFERHHDTGLYMQPTLATEFLDQIGEANKELFKTMKVNQKLWGKYNLSGVHDEDTEAVPNIYDKRRKYHFNEHQKFLEKEEIAKMTEQSLTYDTRLSHKILTEPKNIYQIVEAGLSNPLYATSAIYEILEQLYKQDAVPVLVAVDGMNWFYRPSIYPSFRYESDKGLQGHVPPYHLSLARAFMHLDGHKIRNGYKILASQIYPLHGHTFTPKMIHIPDNYAIEVKGLPLDHYRMFCDYCIENKAWPGDDFQHETIEQFWMETQGNIGETRRCMRKNFRAII